MFLVGGFGESSYLQERLAEVFGPMNIAITLPPSPGTAVMMGAVRFGISPDLFKTRVSKFTYGVGARVDGCSNVLDKFVSFGQAVPCGLEVERVYTPTTPSQKWLSVPICSSTDPLATSVLDSSVSRLATLRVQVPQHVPFRERNITVTMTFGATEVGAVASIGSEQVRSHLVYNAEPEEIGVSFVGSTSVQFLVDVSSSMNDTTSPGRTKMDDAKDGILFVINQVLDGAKGDFVGLSSFSYQYEPIIKRLEPTDMASNLNKLVANGNTNLYSALNQQLKELALSPDNCDKRFLLAFTDGEDNSGARFRDDPSFCELYQLLEETGGVCDQLTGIVVIAVGLTGKGLAPLKALSETGKLKLISFEKGTDIQEAFAVASEEIERLSMHRRDESPVHTESSLEPMFPTSLNFLE
jgi:hypothetical protein